MRLVDFELIDWITDAHLDLDDDEVEAWVRKGFRLTHPHIWNNLKSRVSWVGGERFVVVHSEASRQREAISILNDIEHIYRKFHTDTIFAVE